MNIFISFVLVLCYIHILHFIWSSHSPSLWTKPHYMTDMKWMIYYNNIKRYWQIVDFHTFKVYVPIFEYFIDINVNFNFTIDRPLKYIVGMLLLSIITTPFCVRLQLQAEFFFLSTIYISKSLFDKLHTII